MRAETGKSATPADIARARLYGCVVPEWAKFVSVDADGTVFAWTHEPVANTSIGEWIPGALDGRIHLLGKFHPLPHSWENALTHCDLYWEPPARRRDDASQAVWFYAFMLALGVGVIVILHLLGWL